MDTPKSLLEMASGAFMERVDYEMPRIIDNILDPNTQASAKRKITITMEFIPDEDRSTIITNFSIKSALAPTNPARTTLYIAGDNASGELTVVEMTPQIPGQTDLYGGEKEAPPVLKLVKQA